MLKMYSRQDHGGSSPDFWEDNWDVGNFEESLRFCSNDPLRPLFEKYSGEGSLMLEGGCGLGQYLAYYAYHGRRVVGLDFAQRALKRLSLRQPGIDLCAGDVAALPFDDETFDLYYSGGVVEHFEGGAEAALAEARRVLKRDGVLLISVPYQSPLRRVLAPTRREFWKKVDGPSVGDAPDGLNFFQYAYTPREFGEMLGRAGLTVVEKQGYAVIWGLDELPLVGGRVGEFAETASAAGARPATAPGPVEVEKYIDDRTPGLLKRLAVREDDTVPVLGLGVKFMRWAAANMMMYVCKRKI